MLQQTRAETVAARFEAFLARFPTLEALAAGTTDELLAAWSGLGYYRRALDLQRAARQLGSGAAIPRRAAELLALPGIGEYTAAAIASIAFDEVIPVLDGNVARVAARLSASPGDATRLAARRRLRAIAAGLIDAARPGDSNQALMELGATVCLPRAPRCPHCPLAARCRGRAAGDPERFPARRRSLAVRRVRVLAAVVRGRGGVLLVRDGAQRYGAWEVPWIELTAGKSAPREAHLERALGARYGGTWRLGRARGTVRHAITTRRLTLEVREAALERGAVGRGEVREGVEARWFREDAWRALPRSSLVDKILAVA